MANITLKNGRGYDSGMFTVMYSNATTPVVGWTNISLKSSREAEFFHGAGNKATSYGLGNYTYGFSITLTLEEVEQMRKGIASGSLLDGDPVDVNIVGKHPQADKLVNYRVHHAICITDDLEINQNDKSIPVTIEYICAEIYMGKGSVFNLLS